MKPRNLVEIFFLILSVTTVWGAWISPEGQAGFSGWEVIESTPQKTVVRFHVYSADTGAVDIAGEKYKFFEVNGMARGVEPNEPSVGAFSLLLACGDGPIRFSIVEKKSTTLKKFRLIPESEPQADLADWIESKPTPNRSIYDGIEPFPKTTATFGEPAIIRGVSVRRILVYPIRYLPDENSIEIDYDLTVAIEHEPPPPIEERLALGSMFEMTRGFVVNPDALRVHRPPRMLPEPESSSGAEYLIITVPEFEVTAQVLADWKNRCGIDTEVRTTTETGGTAAAIQSYIQNAYDTWSPTPEYLLIIGDAENVPTTYTTDDHPYEGTKIGTDLYYVTTDGSDYYPEIFYGRLPVQDQTQATNAVNRIIAYEKVTYSLGSDFYNHATCAAYFQDDDLDDYADRRFAQTSEEIRDYLISSGYTTDRIYYTEPAVTPTNWNTPTYSSGEPIPAELLKPGFPWDGSATDVTNAVNAGRFFISHRDHGYRDGWGEPAYSEAQVAALTNGNEVPVIMSMNCQTGWFDNETDETADGTGSTDECFCEAWWRNSNGGTVGIIGATRVSYSGYNDYLAMGFIDGIWEDFNSSVSSTPPTEGRLGACLTYGKYYMEYYWSDWDLEWEIFHWFGDPTMRLFREEPDPLSAAHVTSVAPGNGSIDVTVTCLSVPVENSTVCITDDANVWSRGTTNASGFVNIPYTGAIGGTTLYLTATARDKKPYEGTITVISDLPEAPELVFPFDNARIGSGVSSTEPQLEWAVPDDPNDDPLHFGVRWDEDDGFGSATLVESFLSTTGFSPVPPLPDGTGNCAYTINSQSEGAMENDSTYWWQASAHDGLGYGNPSEVWSLTIDNTRSVVDWFQTTTEQFETGTPVDVETADNKISVTGITIIMEDDFESYASQAEFATVWTVSGSRVYWSDAASYSATHSIYIDDSQTSSSHYFYRSFSAMSAGYISVYSGCATTTDEGEIISIFSGGGLGTWQGQVYYRAGYIAYWDGSSRTNLEAIDAGSWHHFRVDFDVSTDEIYVTIDGGSAYGPFEFGATPAAITTVQSGPRGLTSYTGDLYYDDYEVGIGDGAGAGTLTSPPIVFDWNPGFSSWNTVIWTQGADDSIIVVVDERAGGSWIPSDSSMAAATATAGTLDISALTATDTIRLRAKLVSKSGNDPDMFDWAVSWTTGEIGVEIYKGGPAGARYNTTSWAIGNVNEGDTIIMSAGDVAYILNSGSVPIDIRIKAETSGGWTFGDIQGANELLLLGLFDQGGTPPPAADYVTPMDRINTGFRTSGTNNPEPFVSPRSNGVNVSVSEGRYLYLLFATPTPNTLPVEQTITVTIEVIGS